MNVEGIGKNIIGKLEDNAMLLTAVGAAYARAAEDGDGLSGLIRQFTTFSATDGFIGELLADVGLKQGSAGALDNLKWKLWESPHLYTKLIKVGLAVWIGGQLGIVPARYEKLGANIGKGAAIAALLMPGHGSTGAPSNSSTGSVFVRAPQINNAGTKSGGNIIGY